MQTVVRLNFNVANAPGGGRALLEEAGCGPDVATIDDVAVLDVLEATVTLDEDDPRLSRLLDILRGHGMTWLELRRDLYTEEELDAAPLLVLQPLNTCSVSGGVRYGMTYDLSGACPACGTGGRQTSGVFIRGDELGVLEGRALGATMPQHVFVDERIAGEIVRIGATGVSFHGVFARMPDGRQVKLRWQQICGQTTLPKMSPRTTGLVREGECKVCDRNGYATTILAPPRFVYRKADLLDAADVNQSWENYGGALLRPEVEECKLSTPWLLVSPRVRRVILKAGATDVEWFPVRVVDV